MICLDSILNILLFILAVLYDYIFCVLTGKYFFELDEKAVLPGYPKRIADYWGIKGPIDAAFTRINCQGKTYIFKVWSPENYK